MGWWKSEHGVLGDGPADIMDDAFREIIDLYQTHCDRSPTQGEIADLIEFCSAGLLRPVCGNVNTPFNRDTMNNRTTPRAAVCGEQGPLGKAACTSAGEHGMANVDPKSGNNYTQQDLSKIIRLEVRDLKKKRKGLPLCG